MLERPQVVHFVKTTRSDELIEQPNAFTFRKDRGRHWLQRLAFAILRWIGAYQQLVVTTWTRSQRQNDALLTKLLGQEGEWLERLYRREQLRIYMGPDDHADLMGLVDHMGNRAVTFTGRINVCSGADRNGSWHDVPITVVPWMSGAVIVPIS